ncbi:MAG: ATP-binding protein [Balneolaceae bacterium]
MIKNFRMGVIIRVLLIAATLLLLMHLFLETEYHMSMAIVVLIAVVQLILLIKYLEQTNILLTRFLDAIKYSDFTGTFRNQEMGQSFEDLNKAFSQVIERFKEERNKKEESLRYLETVVQHIGIGMICFNVKGEVVLLNTAAKGLFQVAMLRKIESLKDISGVLFNSVQKLKNGGRNLIRVTVNKETMQLAVYATEFRMRDEAFKLVSFQNIHTELEEKEMESWQNLTQVLAHEIMNSITPIASLSGTVHMLLEQNTVPKEENFEIDAEILEDVKEALNTISKRSEGLMRFVNSYRDFTEVPEPNYELFNVKETLERVASLMKPEATKEHIEISCNVEPKSLELTADPHLVEQVLINLVKNAIRILSGQENGTIELKGTMDSYGKVLVQIIDNGPGVKKSVSEKIFIPFYSISANPENKGSGIGLSLSRQIMRLHGGSLTLTSEPGKGSIFTMRF